MQSKITATHHFATTRMATIKKINTTNVSKSVKQMGHLYIVSEKKKCHSHFGKLFGIFLQS